MNKVLMASPQYYDVTYEINPWMSGNIGKINKERAKKQWNNFRKILKKKGVTVYIQEYIPNIECPDMVFTANHGMVIGGTFVASNFLNRERKIELPYVIPTILKKGNFEKYDQCPYTWEGEAELFHYSENYYIGGYGQRAIKKAFFWFEKGYGIKIIKLKMIDPKFYHLDTCLTIRNNTVFIYPDAFKKEDISRMKKKLNVYEVDKEIAYSFSLNCIQLDDCVIIGNIDKKIIEKLTKIFKCQVIGVDMSEFIFSGGSCFCSKLNLG